jgi:hypothetical protein
MPHLLEALNKRLGPPPRTLVDRDLAMLLPKTTLADVHVDQWLSEVWSRQEQIVLRGELMIGDVFMCDTSLREPGDKDGVGGVVYSNDPIFALQHENLEEVGTWLYDRHGSLERGAPLSRSPWVRWIRDIVGTGYESRTGARLPAAFTRGRTVWAGGLLINRSALPNGVLRSLPIPLLVLRESHDHLPLIVHHALWPANHREAWLRTP